MAARKLPPLKGHFRVRWPDGTIENVKLPSAQRVKLGGNTSVMMVWPKGAKFEKQRLVVAWFRRVRGGWNLIAESGGKRRCR